MNRTFILALSFAYIFAYDPPADIPKFFEPEKGVKPSQMIPPSKAERFLSEVESFIYVDALFIKPRLVGLAFAVEAVNPIYDITDIDTYMHEHVQKVYYPHFRHSLGYKIGAGVYLDPDGLELRANFMALQEHTHCNKLISFSGYGFGTWDPIPLACSSSSFELHFYRANFDLVYSFFANQYINFDVYFGCIASWQKQYFDIYYLYASEGWPITDDTGVNQGYPWVSSKIYNKCNYSGYGARAGLTGQFYFSHQFSLRSNIALNLPWSTYGVDTKQTRFDADDNGTVRYNFNQCITALSPVLDFSTAFCADRWFRQRTCNAAIMIGYEEQIWFAQNRFETPSNLFNGKGALFLQGCFVKLQITI